VSELKLSNTGKSINPNNLKGGLKKEQIKDDKNLKAIFESIDADNNGILDKDEIKEFKKQILEKAGADGKLSKKESGKYLKQNHLEHLEKKDLLKFIDLLSQSSDEIKDSTCITDENNKKTIQITYNDESVETINPDGTSQIATQGENGETIVKKFDKNKKITSTEITNKDGSKTITKYDENGIPTEIITENKDGSKTTKTFNDQGEPLKEVTVAKGGNPTETITYSAGGGLIRSQKQSKTVLQQKNTPMTKTENLY